MHEKADNTQQPPETPLSKWLSDNMSDAEHLSFSVSCHSVEEAAEAAGVKPADLVKSICMIGESGELLVAVVKGEDRANPRKVGRAVGMKPPRLATPEEILQRTGYPCGGTPPFGFSARFLVDEKVLEMETVYGGGGSETSLVRVTPAEMLRLNGGVPADIAKRRQEEL